MAGYINRIRDNRWTGHRVSPPVYTTKGYDLDSETMERRTKRLLEGYHLAQDCAR